MSYTAHLIPAGLHPQLSISTTAPPCECDLYAHLPLAPSFIPDRFQLAQLHTEGRLGSYDPASSEGTLRVGGSRDLEGPLRGAEGSEVLLRLSEGRRDMKGKGREMEMVEVEVPLHLRYQRPVQERWVGGERADTVQVELEWPRVFWACEDDRGESFRLLKRPCSTLTPPERRTARRLPTMSALGPPLLVQRDLSQPSLSHSLLPSSFNPLPAVPPSSSHPHCTNRRYRRPPPRRNGQFRGHLARDAERWMVGHQG